MGAATCESRMMFFLLRLPAMGTEPMQGSARKNIATHPLYSVPTRSPRQAWAQLLDSSPCPSVMTWSPRHISIQWETSRRQCCVLIHTEHHRMPTFQGQRDLLRRHPARVKRPSSTL